MQFPAHFAKPLLSLTTIAISALFLIQTPAATAQTTWYVDDNAPNDPAPGDPSVSDPYEDGSAAHPFDAIREAIDVTTNGDEVVVADGTYTGWQNRDINFNGRSITLRGLSGDPALTIIDCENNGGAFVFYNQEQSDAVVSGLTITNAEFSGAIYCSDSSPTIMNCVIRDNNAAGISCRLGAAPTITGCTISGNGGGLHCQDSSPSIRECTISGNYLQGLYCTGGSPTMTDCVISDHMGDDMGAGAYFRNSSPTLVKCVIRNNSTTYNYGSGGVYCFEGYPTFQDCVVCDNAGVINGGIYFTGDGEIVGGVIERNAGAGYEASGGVRCNGNVEITGCTIRGNTGYEGGGIRCAGAGKSITNCLITGNLATEWGGGILCLGGDPTISLCTITDNVCVYGGGICCRNSAATVTNCILWNNAQQGIYNYNSSLSVTFSNIEGGRPGIGNIDVDPMFAFDNDPHLMPDSPCIDAGTNSLPIDDLDGNVRPLDGDGDTVAVVDMGAYEFNPDVPSIATSAEWIKLVQVEGATEPADYVLSLRNCGGGTLNWAIDGWPAWLSVSPVTGSSTGEVDDVVLSADISSLPTGFYSAVLTISDTQAANSLRQVMLDLHVAERLEVPAEYPTIQEAIDAASDEDVVEIADGVYTGPGNKNLDFDGRAITVRSASGQPGSCIIDCENDGRGFIFNSGETTESVVEGLTITNGNAYGGGVSCSNSSNPTIANCRIVNNSAPSSGGGIRCSNASPRFRNCEINGNHASSGGGGIYCTDGCRPIFEGCLISRNTAVAGAAVRLYSWSSSTSLTLINCTLTENQASSQGGAINNSSAGVVLTNCILWGNFPQEIVAEPYNEYVTADHCCIRGGWPGEGNVDIFPFALPSESRLAFDSPCVDAGTNGVLDDLLPLDLDLNSRSIDGDGDGVATVDMGAYEFNPLVSRIAASVTTIGFVATENEDDPADKVISLRNAGGGILNWEISGQPSWLTVLPTTGTSSGEICDVTLSVDIDGLVEGLYSAELQISDPTAANSPRQVLVELYIGRVIHVPGEYTGIQPAIDAAVDGDIVEIANGTYDGENNHDLDFGGKIITVRSASGDPSQCIIDCFYRGRGFYFHSGEGSDSIVKGLSIINGYADNSSPGNDDGGAIMCAEGTSPTIVDCIFSGNSSTSVGGAIFCDNSNPVLQNCELTGNWAYSGGGAYFADSDAQLVNCRVISNTISGTNAYGAGLYFSGGSPTCIDCTISQNSDAKRGGGIYYEDSNPTSIRCNITDNSSTVRGGGIYCTSNTSLVCTDGKISGNTSTLGGGIWCYGGEPAFTNCIITNNSATDTAGALDCYGYADVTLTNCTIAGNQAVTAGAIRCANSDPKLANCVVWNNTPQQILLESGNLVVNYSNVQDDWPGIGNINADPLFTDPDGQDNDPATYDDNDYTLASSSPCIDAGSNGALPADTTDLDNDGDIAELLPFDLDGQPRFIDDPQTADTGVPILPDYPAVVDMGAYEYQLSPIPGDFDHDGDVDLQDYVYWLPCLTGPNQAMTPGCEEMDLDQDSDVDLNDFAKLQLVFR